MNTPVFRLNPTVVSRVVWHDLFAELDLEIDQVRSRLAKLWEQCEATRTIRERFGVKNAYLVGEKLLTFARAADEDSEFAAELPRFQAAVWEISTPMNSAAM